MSIHCIWDASYSVGDEELDRQHQRMFHLVNALPERLAPDLIRQMTLFLLKHAAEHFSAEEARMKVIAYPDLDEHRILHDQLVAEVGRFLQMRFSNDDEVIAFKNFARSWVLDHIVQQDMGYFEFERHFRAQGRNRTVRQHGGSELRHDVPRPVVALSDLELESL